MAEGGNAIDDLFAEIATSYPEIPPFWMSEEDRQCDCLIKSFASWSDFAIARTDDVGELTDLMMLIENLDRHQVKPLQLRGEGMLVEGMPCLAKTQDAVTWERGTVKEIKPEESKASIYSVDFGETYEVAFPYILPLPKRMGTLHGTAITAQIMDAATFLPNHPSPDASPKQGPYTFLFFDRDEANDRLTVLTDANSIKMMGQSNEADSARDYVTNPNFPEQQLSKGSSGLQQRTFKQNGKTARYTYNMAMQFIEKLFSVTDNVYATSMEVKEIGGERRLALVCADSCKLNGGSMKDVDMRNMFKEADQFYMNGKLNYMDEENENGERVIAEAEWKVTNILTGNAPKEDSPQETVIQGVLSDADDEGGKVICRLWQESIWVPKAVLAAVATDKLTGGDGKLDMYRTVIVRCKTMMRAGFKNCRFVASAVEIPQKAVEATGIVYFVTPVYTVALRLDNVSKFEEYDRSAQYVRNIDAIQAPFRYCYLPNAIIDAEGLPMTEWYGMPIMFRCNEDQPGDQETPYEPRWKAFFATINPQTDRTDFYKYRGIWQTDYTQRTLEAMQVNKLTDDDRRLLIVDADVQDEWSNMRTGVDALPVQDSAVVNGAAGETSAQVGDKQVSSTAVNQEVVNQEVVKQEVVNDLIDINAETQAPPVQPQSSTIDIIDADGDHVHHFEHPPENAAQEPVNSQGSGDGQVVENGTHGVHGDSVAVVSPVQNGLNLPNVEDDDDSIMHTVTKHIAQVELNGTGDSNIPADDTFDPLYTSTPSAAVINGDQTESNSTLLCNSMNSETKTQ